MKLLLIKKLAVLMAMWLIFTPLVFAQNAPQTEEKLPANIAAETMSADDKLPFMQHEEKNDQESMSTGAIIAKTIGAMLIVVGLIFFGAWGLKKLGYGGLRAGADANAPELSIISSVTVGNGRTISSVKFGNRMLLVGSTAQSFTLLADGADDDIFPADAINSAAPRSVADMLAEENSFEEELVRADSGLISLFQGGRI